MQSSTRFGPHLVQKNRFVWCFMSRSDWDKPQKRHHQNLHSLRPPDGLAPPGGGGTRRDRKEDIKQRSWKSYHFSMETVGLNSGCKASGTLPQPFLKKSLLHAVKEASLRTHESRCVQQHSNQVSKSSRILSPSVSPLPTGV